ncbi:hypothetical protein HSBAA_29230 [Vreelandella sulfidaeris]|uniref:Toprim domain-containing protein n=1 Tax=Vreelandella sulfidaeris TaxID=115553 RepID=A0A455U7W0_9GAMM|nr:hypothetical protein HSBAA_29230 [Halomonas sulfidaeris]
MVVCKATIDAPSGKQVIDHLEGYFDAMGYVVEREHRETTFKALSGLPDPIITLPAEGGSIPTYLWERGVTAKTCAKFKLHFSDTGVFRYELNGYESQQDFYQRVIIPVFDITGDLKTFQGRDITGTQEDKYRFALGMPASGAYLYNGHNALGKQHVIVGEGAFDVWSLSQYLWDQGMDDVEAVGTFGKHLSQTSDDGEDQLSAFLMLKEAGLKTVTFMWDSEPAAIRDALKACDLLTQHGFSCRMALLPTGLDPNEATPAEVGRAISQAQPYSKALQMKMRLQML